MVRRESLPSYRQARPSRHALTNTGFRWASLIVPVYSSFAHRKPMTNPTPKILVPLADGFEEIEAVTVIDVLRRADLDVTVAALGNLQV